MEKIKIPYPIIVEGKYDKIKLDSIADADVFTTDGFGIFTDGEKASLFKQLAEKRGKIIILTDSDGGGTLIRSHIKSLIPANRLINLYVPAVKGKEKRKSAPSKEGLLGVEGTDSDMLLHLLLPFASSEPLPPRDIKKLTLYECGLVGVSDASFKRERLAKKLGLPPKMTPNALLSAVSLLYRRLRFNGRRASRLRAGRHRFTYA